MAFSSSMVTVNHVQLHVRIRQGGHTPLLLVHGLTDSSVCWGAVASALAPEFAITTYDLRGHGLSDAPSDGYSPVDHALDLLGVLDALELRQAIVLGHSLGAETAAVAATLAPGRISRLVLEDPPWVPSWIGRSEVECRASIQTWQNDVRALQSLSKIEAWEKARRDNTTWTDEELRPWLESKRQMRLIAFESAIAERQSWLTIVDKIQCPTLLLSGDVAKSGFVSPEVGREVMARNPRLRWVQLTEAGHCIHRDCLAEYLRRVEPFLREPD